MKSWLKPKHPIDRAVRDLDRELARVQREIHALCQRQPPSDKPAPAGAPPVAGLTAESMTAFVKNMLVPPKKTAAATCQTRVDLFDVTDEPLKELETEPIAFGQKPVTDLFVRPDNAVASGPSAGRPGETGSLAQRPGNDSRLAQYLSAGSIKTYRPLKHVRRQERNRFFMWLGLAAGTLWVVWVVIR